jgi:hypothetical protein
MTSRPSTTPRDATRRPAEPGRPEPAVKVNQSLVTLRLSRKRSRPQPSGGVI